ncbi:tRNA 2-thiouridine(34) synthase MnmA [Candidatus Babeliales bacterium]|nr:tRNA 2-thiouridine(34) synthase MnmA [Candidatus Babeliales bacterium]
MKIAMLVSGGVDSSVALRLVKNQGHDVTAFYLKIWLEDELAYLGECPWQEDLDYAQKVCDQAGVELKVVSLQQAYHEKIVAYTIKTIKEGRTPNPDVLCNTMIKFGAFYDEVGKEYDAIATGHYAQVVKRDGIFYLHQTPDPIKDQTYFLSQLTPAQLSRVMFPIGEYKKSEVRELATLYDLPNKNRKDSQGLCFLGKIKFRDFVKHHVGTNPGQLVEYETGKVWGEHEGFWFYTVGQRQGIGLSHGPWYVVKTDPETNTVFISSHYKELEKTRDTFSIGHCNWFAGSAPHQTTLKVKLRHGPQEYTCSFSNNGDGTFFITLPEDDQGLAAGQFAVFYDNGLCLGSGVIL